MEQIVEFLVQSIYRFIKIHFPKIDIGKFLIYDNLVIKMSKLNSSNYDLH